MFRCLLVFLLLSGLTLSAQREGEKEGFRDKYALNPDRDGDLKVDSGELKRWTGQISYMFNNGSLYMEGKLLEFVKSFDENKDGVFNSLEFRRFQTGSKKLFSDAYDFLEEKFDENKNRRLDKEERIAAITKIKNLLTFSLSINHAEKEGHDAEIVLDRKRGLNDIYD